MTLYRTTADQLDGEERVVEAAWAYELATRDPDADLDVFLNLVALYLSVQDEGFAATHRVSAGFVAAASQRVFDVLDEAEQRFGRTGEIDSWRLYLRERVAYEDVPDAAYEEVAARTGALMAYYRLYVGSGGRRYGNEVRPLFERIKELTTERNRYLNSVLHSAALPRPPVP